jgi:malonate decarboxylase gamma subunit
MIQTPTPISRGSTWFAALTRADGIIAGAPLTVRVADAQLGADLARFIVVVPDPTNRFPRARHGEVGLDEAWTIADQLRRTVSSDVGKHPRPIVAVVDAIGQAYGRTEELLGLHLACAAAAEAYATARLAGHPVIALLVGKAMSGAFLAHGYQANRIVALDDPGVIVHAMGKPAAARIMRRSVEELEQLAHQSPPMCHDIRTFAQWGLVHSLIVGLNADAPEPNDIHAVQDTLGSAVNDARRSSRDLSSRLESTAAATGRAASVRVRKLLAEQWDET